MKFKFDDDGNFTVISGQLKSIPEGWKEVKSGRFEPQWPVCRLRGLSRRVVSGVPIFVIHCHNQGGMIDFETCKACKFVDDPDPHKRGIQSTPQLSEEGLLDSSVESLPGWPQCVYRSLFKGEGCCERLVCTHSGNLKQDKRLCRKDCVMCQSCVD